MTDIFNPYIAISHVDAIRTKVLIRRDACLTAFARDLHDRLVERLDAMRADLKKELPFWDELIADRHKPEAAAFDFEIYFMRPCFAQRWIDEGPYSILEEISVMVSADGEVCGVTLDHTEVPTSELEGLDELFAEIRREIGVTIKAARVNRG